MPKSTKKSSKATVKRRTHEVMQLILAGAEFPEIRQYTSEREWRVSERQIYRYIEVAYDQIAKILEREQPQLLARHLMQRRALYARSLKASDHRTALQVLRDEAELQGLYPPSKREVSGEMAHEHTVAALTDAELERIARQRIARQLTPSTGTSSARGGPWTCKKRASCRARSTCAISTAAANAALVIDATGVGRPVVEMFRGLKLPNRIVAVTITAGQAETFHDGFHRVVSGVVASRRKKP